MTGPARLDIAQRAYIPSWEHIGAELPEEFTDIDAARRAANLDWEPTVEPVFRRERRGGTDAEPFYEYAEPVGDKLGSDGQPAPLFKLVTRGPGGPVLDCANRSYQLFGNGEMFEVARAIGQAGAAAGRPVRFVSGGEVAGGKRTFLMADLGTTELRGDPSPHVRYLGIVNGHDGGAALKVIGTDLRWWCTNQIKASEMLAKQNGTAFTFRHTGNIAARVAGAQQAIIAAMRQLELVHDESQRLLEVKVTARQRQEFIEQFALARTITKTDVRRAAEAQRSPQRANALEAVTGSIAEILASPTCEGIADTAYGLFAATVEFLDHKREARGGFEGVFGRTVLNTEPAKQLALATLHGVL